MTVLRARVPAFAWVAHISAVLALVFLLALVYARMAGPSRPAALVLLSGAIILSVFLLVAAPLLAKVTFDGRTLVLSFPPQKSRRFDAGAILSVSAADYSNDAGLKPVFRTNGMSLGPFKLGFFILASRKPAMIMTDRSRVLVIHTEDTDILIGHDHADELERAVRRCLDKTG